MRHPSLFSPFALVVGFLGFLALSTFTFIGCSGGSGPSATTDSTDTTDDVTNDTLKSLSNLPDIDVDNLDVTSQTGSALKIAGLTTSALRSALVSNDSTDFSRAGCEYRQMIDEVKFTTADVQSNICIIKALEAADIGVSVPDSGCNYYLMTIPAVFDEGHGDIDEDTVKSTESTFSVKVRICFNEDLLTLSLCDNESGTDAQTMWFDMKAVDGKFNGNLVDIFPSSQGSSVSEGFKVAIDLPKQESLADYQEGDEGMISAQFNGVWGNGSMGLISSKEAEVATNVVTGSFQSVCDASAIGDCGDFTGSIYTKANADGGCSQFSSSGTFPAWDTCSVVGTEACQELITAGIADSTSDFICFKPCEITEGQEPFFTDCVEADDNGNCVFEDTGTECFTFSKDSDGTLHYYTYDTDQASADATIQTYHTLVSAQDLSTHEVPTVAFASDQVWDCAAADSFTEIDLSDSSNLSALDAMGTCFAHKDGQNDARDKDSCHDQEGEKDFEKANGGEEVDTKHGTYGGGSDIGDSVGQECSSGADCENGLQCDTSINVCSKPCRNDSDCSAGSFGDVATFTCNDSGFCAEISGGSDISQSCTADSDCVSLLQQTGIRSTAICGSGQCMVSCQSDASVCTQVSQAFGQTFSCAAVPGAGNFCVPQ